MKILKQILTILIVSAVIPLSSCSKDDGSNDDNSSSVKQLMVDKPWKCVKLEGKSTAVTDWQELNILECNKDNLTIYKDNGDMIVDYAAKKCSESQPNTVVYATWELHPDDKKFTTHHKYDNSQVWVNTIEELTATRFVYYSILVADGVTNELRYYLEH